jgi:hypothetical protein
MGRAFSNVPTLTPQINRVLPEVVGKAVYDEVA